VTTRARTRARARAASCSPHKTRNSSYETQPQRRAVGRSDVFGVVPHSGGDEEVESEDFGEDGEGRAEELRASVSERQRANERASGQGGGGSGAERASERTGREGGASEDNERSNRRASERARGSERKRADERIDGAGRGGADSIQPATAS
jgi:hypothetical protein